MKEKLIFALFLLSFSTLSTFAQTKTVNNFDLKKYRMSRLQAEKDLSENYVKLGFPSPEELAKQTEQDAAERVELSNRLRAERLERERIENERRQIDAEAARYNAEFSNDNNVPQYSASYYGGYGYPYYGGVRRARGYKNRFHYRVTPVGVYPIPNPRPRFRTTGRRLTRFR
jgi:hypothetical protein